MPSGILGFPRLTDIGPFVTEDIDWVLHPEVYHSLWNKVQDSDAIDFAPEPSVLIVHDNSSLDSELLHEHLFSRLPKKEYNNKWMWEKISSRFSVSEHEVTLERAYTEQDKKLFPEEVKFQSQMYTKHGAMITFDFKQKWTEEVRGFMRAPVTNSMLSQAKKAVAGLPHSEFFELQSREESVEFATANMNTNDAQLFQHPHYRSTGIKTKNEMKKMFDVLIELAEEYEQQRNNQ